MTTPDEQAGANALPVIEDRDGALAIITLNCPDKLNALDATLLDALLTALRAADRDPAVRAIVLGGAGRAFCAGADRKALAALDSEQAIRGHARRMGEVQRALLRAETPTIAAVHGYALGGGCGLVAACDFAVAARDAVLGYPEAANGILPALVIPSLLRSVGRRRALTLLATARRLTAKEAFDLGLVSGIAERDAGSEAREMARAIASLPHGLMARLKRLMEQSGEMSIDTAIDIAIEANVSDRTERLQNRTASQ